MLSYPFFSKSRYIMAMYCALLCCLLLTNKQLFAAPNLSEEAQISLLTCSPANDLYAAFGHSAIRVFDPTQKLDVVYNYGTFDFGAPNFYLNFVKGKLAYQLSRSRYSSFKRVYIRNNRSMYEQVLQLNTAEKKAMNDFLVNNYLPENRVYLYDFFFDNCSSRIRDILNEQLGNRLRYKMLSKQQSFRDLLQPYLANRPWADWGIHLILGLPTDRTALTQEYMFLPYELMEAFDNASLDEQPLVAQKNTIFEASVQSVKRQWLTPINLLVLFLLLISFASYCSFKRSPQRYTFDAILFGLIGFVGCFFLFMWLFTGHYPTYQNLNMFWAFPLHLPIAFFLLSPQRKKFVQYYFLLTAVVMLFLVLVGRFLPQPMHWASLLLIAALGIRAGVIFFKEKRNAERANILVNNH